MLTGETLSSGAAGSCCGVKLTLRVLRSNGGYYVGTECPNCGPYSRETGYFRSLALAQAALDRLNRGDVADIRT
jgi:hypothetical protein